MTVLDFFASLPSGVIDDAIGLDSGDTLVRGPAGSGIATLPIGMVAMWLFGPPPAGWLFLDGMTTVSDTCTLGVYLISAGLIPADGTITLPDCSARFPFGVSSSNPEMSVGGASSFTMLLNQMPIHGGHSSGSKWVQSSSNTEVGVKATISQGGGLPVFFTPPYFSVRFIIYGGGI